MVGSAQAWLEVNGQRVGDTITVAPDTVVDVCFSLHADKHEDFQVYALPYWYPNWAAFNSQEQEVELQAGQSKVVKLSIKMNNTAKIKALVNCAVINEATGIPENYVTILTKWFTVRVSVKVSPPVETTEEDIVCTSVEYTIQGDDVLFAVYFWNKGNKRGSKVFDVTINGVKYGEISVTLDADATGTEFFTIPLSEVRGKRVCVGERCIVVEGGGGTGGGGTIPPEQTKPPEGTIPPEQPKPSQPSQPTYPTQPTQPSRPYQPTQPSQPPEQPTYPTQPYSVGGSILLPLLGGVIAGVIIGGLLSRSRNI